MTFIWILIGAILFVLGAIVSYFSGIRSLQASRRLADYRVRQRYVARARWSLAGGLFSVAVATVLLIMNRPGLQAAVPTPTIATIAPAATSVSSTAAAQPSSTAPVAGSTPTFFV